MAVRAVDLKHDIDLDTDVVMSDLDYALDTFCSNAGIDDKRSIRPQEWTAALQYINNTVIKPSKTCYNLEHGLPHDRLNLFSVNALLDRYIYMCNLYSQAITIKGFSLLSGISPDKIHSWKSDKTRLYIYTDKDLRPLDYTELLQGGIDGNTVTIQARDLYKKLLENIEQNVNDMVLDGKRKGIGAVVRYNRFYETQAARQAQETSPAFDVTATAQQLGILDHVQALPDGK